MNKDEKNPHEQKKQFTSFICANEFLFLNDTPLSLNKSEYLFMLNIYKTQLFVMLKDTETAKKV